MINCARVLLVLVYLNSVSFAATRVTTATHFSAIRPSSDVDGVRVAPVSVSVVAQSLFTYEDVLHAEERAVAAQRRFFIGAACLAVFAVTWAFFQLRRLLTARHDRDEVGGRLPRRSPIKAAVCLTGARLALILALLDGIGYFTGFLDLRVTEAFVAMVALAGLSNYLNREATRLAMLSGTEALTADPRPPIVYLRAFRDDERVISSNTVVGVPTDELTIEEAVLETFGKFGPIVALRNPGSDMRPGTFAALEAPNEEWQQRALALIQKAAFIVVLVNRSQGLEWELREIAAAGRLEITVFVFQSEVSGTDADRLITWLLKCVQMPEDTQAGIRRVQDGDGMIALRLRPVAIAYKGRLDALGYLLAVRQVAQQFFWADRAVE